VSTQPAGGGSRGLRELPLAATGRPAPFWVTAPAYLFAVLGWTAAAAALVAASDEIARGAIWESQPVLPAHLVGLVLFPFAVASAAWQLLPVMLRNDPPTARARPLCLVLLAAGVPLASAIATDRDGLAGVFAALLAGGVLMLLAEVAALVRGAPAGRLLVVSRPAVLLAGAHGAVAFALGAVAVADSGPEPLGVPYERFLLIHLSIALVGWLTILIATVGRTLVPMLGLAAAAERRRFPLAELTIAAGLWTYVVGLASETDRVVAVGVVVMAAGLAPAARLFCRVALAGKVGIREGPVAHVAVGLVFLLEAAVLGVGGALGAIDGRRAASAAVLLLGLGWAAGVILGHLGKLVSLSGWGSWPPGPRPSQLALYPRPVWLTEVALFAVGVELLAAGAVFESAPVARGGAATLLVAAVAATIGVSETLRRVFRLRSYSGVSASR
jgi:hypothetical protein